MRFQEEMPETRRLAVSSPVSVLDTPFLEDSDELRPEKRRMLVEPCSSVNLRHRLVCEETLAVLASDCSLRLEEVWLGPVFESSTTALRAIASLPTCVTHLDLDLRNELHILPQALPILFSKTNIKTLSLRLFGNKGAIELAKWVHKNPNLKRLDLRGNRIGSVGARAIAEALIECDHPLSHLNLSCNCILNGDMITRLLQTTKLQGLDLSFNWLGDPEVEEICEGLRGNSTLKSLNLYGCQRISGDGMEIILECLRTAKNMSLCDVGIQSFDQASSRAKQEIDFWLDLNQKGRYLLKGESNNLLGLWPLVLEKSSEDPAVLYYLLRQGGTEMCL